jgi:putative ABC transport system substrate-binding protein
MSLFGTAYHQSQISFCRLLLLTCTERSANDLAFVRRDHGLDLGYSFRAFPRIFFANIKMRVGPPTSKPRRAQIIDTRNLGLQVRVLSASTSREIDMAFATFAQERPDILFIGGDTLFNSRRVQLAVVAARYAVPAIYAQREYVEAGGLISYGTNLADTFRQVGVYAGRILKGVKPADLPVVQSSKFELIINVQTARTLGLTVPPSLLARADEVIE